jgi:hypothetical protein
VGRRAERAARPLKAVCGPAGLIAVGVCGVLIAVDGAAPGSGIVAGARPLHGALGGPLRTLGDPLGRSTFLVLLVAMAAGYALAVAGSASLTPQAAAGIVAGLHVLFALTPPLLSTDVFSYVDYARMGTLHGLNPYAHSPVAAPHDAVFPLVARVWRHTPTAYGPLFTALSSAVAPLGVAASVWTMKALAAASSLLVAWLVAGIARDHGRSPVRAGLVAGLNPVMLVYGVGGAHNDLLMLAAGTAGVALFLRRGEGGAAAAVVAGAAIKASMIIALPYLLADAVRRRAVLAGALGAGSAAAALGLALFGTPVVGFVGVLRRQQALVSSDAFPTMVAHLFGKPGVFPIDRVLLRIVVAIVLLGLLVAVRMGALSWIAATGWALLALVVTTTWLLAWYALWPLPFAVAAGDRRLLAATLAVQALFVVHQLAPLLA